MSRYTAPTPVKTGRTGRLKKDTQLADILHTWPAGSYADEVTGISNTGPTWLLREKGQELTSLAKHDLSIRFPTVEQDAVDVEETWRISETPLAEEDGGGTAIENTENGDLICELLGTTDDGLLIAAAPKLRSILE